MEKANILIVDDEAAIRLAVKTVLSNEGYQVAEAQNADEALAILRGFPPDLVLQDVNMGPGPKGMEVCRRIKANPKMRHISVIMLTGEAEKETVVESLESGADDYILKPFDPPKLLEKIESILSRRPVQGPPAAASENSSDAPADPAPSNPPATPEKKSGDGKAAPMKIKKPVASVMRTKR